MCSSNAAASPMPQLPVTWKEFSELLRNNNREAKSQETNQAVERIEPSRFQVLTSGASDQQADEQRFGQNKLGSWSATYQSDQTTNTESADNLEYTEFEAYA